MAREYSVVVGINAAKATVGGRQFKAGADQVNRSNRGMQRSTARTTKRMTAMITTMGRFRGVASLMFAGFLGVGGIGAVIRTLAQFETKISQVTALISAQSPRSLGGAMAALSERARELGSTTLFTATQAAEGMRFLSLAGFDALEVYQAIGPALTLATVGMLDLGQAADIVSNIMSAFNIDAAETEAVVNGLAFTASRTNTSIQQLGQAMKFVGPVAGALGINVNETSVALGILGNSGLQASLAGTSLRRVMSGLLNPSKEAKKVFSEWGVTQDELVSTMQGPKGLVNLVDLLAQKGINAADAFLLFGQRGAPGLLSLVNQRGKLRELTDDLEEMGDIAAEQAAIIADNLGGDARLAISALQEAILQLGDSGFGNWLREVTQSAAGFVREMTGVETPADKMTSSMKRGAAFAQTLKEKIDLLKLAAFSLAGILVKNVVVGLFRSVTAMGASTVAAYANAVAMGAAGLATAAWTVALNLLIGTLVASGIGAIIIGIGLLLQWAVASDDTAMSTEELTEAMEDQRIEAEKLVFTFDLVGEAAKRLAVVKVEDQLRRDKAAMEELNKQMGQATFFMDSLATQAQVVKDAQAALNEEVSGTEAWTTANANVTAQTLAYETLRAVSRDLGIQELEAEFESLSLRIANGEDDLIGMRLVLEGKIGTLKAYREGLQDVNKALEEQRVNFEKLTGITQGTATAFSELQDEADPAAIAIAKVQVKMDLFNKIAALTDKQLEELKLTEEDLAAVQAQLNQEMTAAEKILNDVEKAAKKVADAGNKWEETLNDLRGEMDPLVKLEVELARRADDVIAAWVEAEGTAGELAEALKVLNDLHDKNIKKLKDTCEETKDLEDCMSDSSKAMVTLWDQALRNIQDAFADAFRGAFDSSSDFFDKILDAFKDMISQMLAAWAVSGIVNLFSGNSFSSGGNGFGQIAGQFISAGASSLGRSALGLGGGASSGGASGTSALSGVLPQGTRTALSNAYTGLASSVSAFSQGILNFAGQSAAELAALSGGNMTFATSGFSNATNAAINNPGSYGAGQVVGAAGVGMISGAIADAILGSRGNPLRGAIFAAIGGIIGSAILPGLGTIIGGAIGGLVDNILGGAKKLESATLDLSFVNGQLVAMQEKVVSKQKAFFGGKSLTTTSKDISNQFNVVEYAFLDFAESLMTTAESIGGVSDFMDDFEFDGGRSINLLSSGSKGAIQTKIQELFLAGIQAFLDDVEGLSARVVTTLDLFKNNLDNFVKALKLVAGIENLFDLDLESSAQDTIEELREVGIMEAYNNSLESYRALIAEYDGSLASLELLRNATAMITQSQLDLIVTYQMLDKQLSSLFQGSAQTIREALLSEEELYGLRRTQIDDLVAQAALTTDPEELSRLAQEIDRLGLEAFNMLDAEQQALLGPEFIEFFEGLDALFGDQIAEGIGSIVQDQADLDIEVATRMEEAAQAIIDANDAARDLWTRWREDLEDTPHNNNSLNEYG